jgi:hypothetical protein
VPGQDHNGTDATGTAEAATHGSQGCGYGEGQRGKQNKKRLDCFKPQILDSGTVTMSFNRLYVSDGTPTV